MSSSIVLEASPEHVAYALLGSFIIVFGLVSLFVKEKLFISEAFVSTVFGIIIGPYVIGIFNPAGWKDYDNVTLEFTRIVIAVQVMAAGVSLPRSYIVKERLSLFMMIVPLMVMMWITSALLIWGLIPNLDFVEAMIIAACVTPTDPVLSNSVVKGRFAEKHVPPRIRYLLSAESGINDGMGLPFLFLGLYLLMQPSVGTAIAKWFYLVWGYQILLSIIIGGVVGAAARKLVKGAKSRNLIDKESFLVFSIALALAVAGIVSILASDDLLACFITGNVFAWDDWFSNEIAEAHIQEIIDMMLNLACFVYIGASIPFASFSDAALGLSVWRMIVLAIVILMFRRLPFVMALKHFIPALSSYREAAFTGWFGPIGVGAVFFSKVTASMTSEEHVGEDAHNAERILRVRELVFPVVMFLVFSSVLIHGVTVPLLHLQYKYTRTWSRKREDANHAVSRLPHINIGDDIVLRPPTTSGSIAEGEVEQRTIGYDNQRSIGYDNQRSVGFDNQRSIGYDHQRSVNQRSYGYGGSAPYGGFGIAGVPDLSRHSISNSNTVRTLQDVVKEMKEASKGTAANRNLRLSNNNSGGSNSNNNNTNSPGSNSTPASPRDSIGLGFSAPSRGTTPNPITAEEEARIAQELKESHPAMHGMGPHLSDIRSDSPVSSSSRNSTSSANANTNTLRPPPAAHQRDSLTSRSSTPSPKASAIKIHEVEREDDNGVVRIVSRDIEERDRVHLEEEMVEGSGTSSHRRHPSHPHTHSSGIHHLTDLFKHRDKNPDASE
ncbi:Sodium/hydrogen exchanger family-domain-containing protein [Dissophora ornata]|nr:Sodium/hydrogen exchanger family-domain-containing protein [Dissophora ornata]